MLAEAPDAAVEDEAAALAVLDEPAADEPEADDSELPVADEPAVARPAVLPVVRLTSVETAPPII